MVKLKILEILLAIMSRAIEGISIILQQSKFEDPQPNVTKVDDSLKREFLELIFKNLPDVKALIRLRQELAEKSWKGISENDSKMDVDDKEEGDVDQNVKEGKCYYCIILNAHWTVSKSQWTITPKRGGQLTSEPFTVILCVPNFAVF